jgi:inhibitor of KinA
MNDISIFQLGDQALTLSLPSGPLEENHQRIIAIKDWLLTNYFQGLLDIVVAGNSITLIYDADKIKHTSLIQSPFCHVANMLREAYRQSAHEQTRKETKFFRIPVCYEQPFAPDLDFVCTQASHDKETIIRIHTEKIYRVWMIGFLPGFPYLGEVDSRIVVPRKTSPRAKVEAGSVGIAGLQTGIYPLDSPGGWQIIGKTPLRLFTTHAMPPVLLEPGDTVRFYSISREEFEFFSPHDL